MKYFLDFSCIGHSIFGFLLGFYSNLISILPNFYFFPIFLVFFSYCFYLFPDFLFLYHLGFSVTISVGLLAGLRCENLLVICIFRQFYASNDIFIQVLKTYDKLIHPMSQSFIVKTKRIGTRSNFLSYFGNVGDLLKELCRKWFCFSTAFYTEFFGSYTTIHSLI